MSNELKVRYSDEDLLEFREIVEAKLKMAQDELHTTEQQIADLNENGFNQQGGDWYDDSTAHTDLEMLQRLLQRQQRHVQDLKNALLRIQNKTYGICIVTGQLISKERLRLVPHATKSIDGKNIANAGRDVRGDSGNDDFFPGENEEKTAAARPVSDKVRIGGGKKPAQGGGEDWEMDNESIEDAGYQRRKFDEDED